MAETEPLIEPEVNEAAAQAMEVEAPSESSALDGGLKRDRDDAVENEEDGESKKLKVENPPEENPVEETTEEEKVAAPEAEAEGEGGAEVKADKVTVGPKSFGSSVEMFDYFYKFLQSWMPNINVNKYEHVTLLELLKKGHPEPDRKLGVGIKAFQVRFHPQYKSRCFFLVREDDTVDDFSFRKCVDHILPLPENMQVKQDVNKALGGGRGGRGGRGRGRGRGRGGKPRY